MKKHFFIVFKHQAKHAVSAGFTLVELMVVVALLAIVSAIAIPNFTNLIERNNIASQINEFNASMHLARSTAIQRATFVTVCRTTMGTSLGAAPECNSNGYTQNGKLRPSNDWGTGWLVFLDDDTTTASPVPTRGQVDPNDQIIYRSPALNGNKYGILNNGSRQYFTYNPEGQLGVSQMSRITFSASNSDTNKSVCISSTGRLRTVDWVGTTACDP